MMLSIAVPHAARHVSGPIIIGSPSSRQPIEFSLDEIVPYVSAARQNSEFTRHESAQLPIAENASLYPDLSVALFAREGPKLTNPHAHAPAFSAASQP